MFLSRIHLQLRPETPAKKMSLLANLKLTFLLAIIVSSNCKFPMVVSASLSIETDKEALIAFKSQISPESSSLLSSWEPNSSSPCNWTGVVCNRFNHRVVGLNLSSFDLSGSITPYLGNLSFLYSLELQNNQLIGTIPDQINNLFRLRVLNLSSNGLQGSIISNVSKLSELRKLDLSMNKITGKIPEELTSLTELRVLNLGRNVLSGAIPPSIANLSSLEDLILGTNNLSGMIPGDLGRLLNLKVLDLTINNLTGTIPTGIYNMSSLIKLALASNQLWGDLPDNVGVTLPNLLVFNFCINKFTGTIPGSLHNLTNIKVIRMADNLLEGTVPSGLGNLPFLEMYNIGKNKIVSSGDNGLEFITSLTNSTLLKFLAFDGNRLQGIIPESIGNLSKDLSNLYMGGNQIYGGVPASIGHLSGLALLDMSYNSLIGSIPNEIGQLENLRVLSLAGNQFSGSIPDSLGHLQKLNRMDLSRNELVGGVPSTFGNFHDMLAMDLSTNKLNGSIPKEVLNLPSLSTVLNLSNNFLTGELLQDIGLLTKVVTVDLSNNSLSGDIPTSIKNCESLEELYLARNSFTGPVPAALGDMKALEILDVAYNNLSGFIPLDLQNLRALQFLNLAFNDLEGDVPCGGVFANVSNVHLEGNKKLSLQLACSSSRGQTRKPVKIYIIVSVTFTVAICFAIGYFFFMRRRKTKISDISHLIKEQHQRVSYHELCQATENFSEQNFIRNGGFGSVYKGLLVDGSAVAIKVLDVKQTGSLKSFAAECEAFKNVRHRNLVKLITSCLSIDFKNVAFLALVYEFLENGSLEDWIRGKRRKENGDGLNLLERLNVIIDVTSAIDYLHHDCEVPVVHCDLKPSNVLLREDMTAKVGDFGLAKLLIEKIGTQTSVSSTRALKGSIGYIPPEYGLGEKPSTAGDVYSFGVMLLELFTGKSPASDSFNSEQTLVGWVHSAFSSNTILQVLDPDMLPAVDNSVANEQYVIPEKQHDCLIIVIEVGLSCTVSSPDRRINMRNALLKLKSARNNLIQCDRNG